VNKKLFTSAAVAQLWQTLPRSPGISTETVFTQSQTFSFKNANGATSAALASCFKNVRRFTVFIAVPVASLVNKVR